MTQEQLRMQMLAGIITEGQYKAKLNENIAVAKVRRAMEAAIAKIKNPSDIERRINNVKFVVYNSLDPNTNGGERPPSDFQFDDAWWDSTHSQATDSVIASIYGELDAAVKGKSFGEDPMNENEEYVPYQFDDERGKELYLKYDKSYENPSWTRGDFPNSKEIDLQTLLDITGMSLEELKELNTYGDEGWKLDIDEDNEIVTEFVD